MQKTPTSRSSTSPIAIRPRLSGQLVLIPAAVGGDGTVGTSHTSKPITIAPARKVGNNFGQTCDNNRQQSYGQFGQQKNVVSLIGPHSAPLGNNGVFNAIVVGTGNRHYDSFLQQKLSADPNCSIGAQQQGFLQKSPEHIAARTQLAGSYQSSEDNDSIYADSDNFMDEGGNATATPDNDDNNLLDDINPSIDLSNYPQFDVIHLPETVAGSGFCNATVSSPPSATPPSNATSMPFSTSCPESFVRNRVDSCNSATNYSRGLVTAGSAVVTNQQRHHFSDIYNAVNEKDLKERIKKDNHNKVERRRRYHINDRIQELGALLPKKDSDLKANKGNILKCACEYVRQTRQIEEQCSILVSKLQQCDKIAHILVQRIQELENSCNQSGVSPPQQSSDVEWSVQAVLNGQFSVSMLTNQSLNATGGIGATLSQMSNTSTNANSFKNFQPPSPLSLNPQITSHSSSAGGGSDALVTTGSVSPRIVSPHCSAQLQNVPPTAPSISTSNAKSELIQLLSTSVSNASSFSHSPGQSSLSLQNYVFHQHSPPPSLIRNSNRQAPMLVNTAPGSSPNNQHALSHQLAAQGNSFPVKVVAHNANTDQTQSQQQGRMAASSLDYVKSEPLTPSGAVPMDCCSNAAVQQQAPPSVINYEQQQHSCSNIGGSVSFKNNIHSKQPVTSSPPLFLSSKKPPPQLSLSSRDVLSAEGVIESKSSSACNPMSMSGVESGNNSPSRTVVQSMMDFDAMLGMSNDDSNTKHIHQQHHHQQHHQPSSVNIFSINQEWRNRNENLSLSPHTSNNSRSSSRNESVNPNSFIDDPQFDFDNSTYAASTIDFS